MDNTYGHVSWHPACLVSAQQHSLEDGLPSQVELGLVVLDVHAVEPVLDGVQGLGGNGINAQDLEHQQADRLSNGWALTWVSTCRLLKDGAFSCSFRERCSKG